MPLLDSILSIPPSLSLMELLNLSDTLPILSIPPLILLDIPPPIPDILLDIPPPIPLDIPDILFDIPGILLDMLAIPPLEAITPPPKRPVPEAILFILLPCI